MYAFRIRLMVQRKKLYELRCRLGDVRQKYNDPEMDKVCEAMQRIIGKIEDSLYRSEQLTR